MSRRGWVLFWTLSLIWGVPYLLIKVAVTDLTPAVVVFGRCALAALLLLPISAARGYLRPLLPYWRWLLLFTGVEIVVPFGLLAVAEQHLSSSLTGLLVATVPLTGALLAWLLNLQDQPRGRRLAGMVVGLAGVACLVGLDVRGSEVWAVLALAGVAVGYALGPIVVATRLPHLPGMAVSAVALGGAAVVYAPFAVLTWPEGGMASVPAEAWWSVVALGVLCSAVAFLVFFALIAEVGPARTTLITYLNPAVALLLGVLLLDEPLTAGLLVGFPLVLLGSWLATRRSPAALPRSAG